MDQSMPTGHHPRLYGSFEFHSRGMQGKSYRCRSRLTREEHICRPGRMLYFSMFYMFWPYKIMILPDLTRFYCKKSGCHGISLQKWGVEHQTWGFTNQKWGISEAKEGYSIHPISLAGGFHSRYFSSMTIPTLYTVPLRFGKDDSVKMFGTFVQILPDFDKLGGRLAGQMYNDVYIYI